MIICVKVAKFAATFVRKVYLVPRMLLVVEAIISLRRSKEKNVPAANYANYYVRKWQY